MHQAGPEPLEQLALAEDDRDLVAGAPARVAGPVDRLARLYEPDQEADAANEQRAAGRDRDRERNGGRYRGYAPLAFLISAEIAGTISWRSPITA
jgi:hypothetical protein